MFLFERLVSTVLFVFVFSLSLSSFVSLSSILPLAVSRSYTSKGGGKKEVQENTEIDNVIIIRIVSSHAYYSCPKLYIQEVFFLNLNLFF